MTANTPYHYDFNYSLNLDPAALRDGSEEREFSVCARQLGEYQMIKGREVHQFYQLLIKQGIFIKLGRQLQELVELQFQLTAKKNMRDMDQLYFLRQEMCESIKELNLILGREKEYYINIIVLFLTVILLRVIHKKHDVEIEKPVLFHFVHWEVKGQHSTDTFYLTLTEDILKVEKLELYARRNPIIVESLTESLTFKQVQNSINQKRSTMGSSFALAFNKENQGLTQHRPVLKPFKKGSGGANSVIDLQSLRPTTFSNCLIGK